VRGALVAAALAALVLLYLHAGRPLLARFRVVPAPADDTLSALKALLAFGALWLVLHETIVRLRGRPPCRRLVAALAGALAALGVAGFLASDTVGSRHYYHLWDFFHYYIGARYHAELGYEGLYACTAVAEAESDPAGATALRARPMRDLATYGQIPSARALDAPQACKAAFSAERWERFRADVAWFRGRIPPDKWRQMQIDHGYNPPPLWTTVGGALANAVPAGDRGLALLASLDVLLLCGLFWAVWWAFGWRAMCLGLVFLGAQFPANGYFTAGAFLRQDWLALAVASVCLVRRGHPAAGGAALAASALLRLFPAFLFAGPAIQAAAHLVRRRRFSRAHLRFFAGAAAGAVLLTAATLPATGAADHVRFWTHIRRHGAVTLDNNMGLRVLVARVLDRTAKAEAPRRPVLRVFGSSEPGEAADPETLQSFDSGRTKSRATFAQDERAAESEPAPAPRRILRVPGAADDEPSWLPRPRTAAARAVFAVLAAAAVLLFAAATWRLRTLWLAQVLGLVLLVSLPEITCYYYSIFVLAALAARASRRVETALLAASGTSAALVVWPRISSANPDSYAAQSAVFASLALVMLLAFVRLRRARDRTRPGIAARP